MENVDIIIKGLEDVIQEMRNAGCPDPLGLKATLACVKDMRDYYVWVPTSERLPEPDAIVCIMSRYGDGQYTYSICAGKHLSVAEDGRVTMDGRDVEAWNMCPKISV